MVKLSLFVMIGLTVAIAIGLRWREERMAMLRPQQRARTGWLGQRKRVLDRWVTAAALAAVTTMLFLGGINWLRIWTE